LQKSINSGFGAASTADYVLKGVNLSGKIAIVTGGYSGLLWADLKGVDCRLADCLHL
jgi:hypothetical protein